MSSRLREFHPSELIPDSAPLVDLLERLVAAPRAFVLSREGVTGIATRGDLQKAPVRAYLFGLITALEMTLTQRIRDSHKEPVWTRWLSSGRIEKARELLKLRRSRNEEIDLLECLQLADKRTLALRSPSVRPQLPFDRKTAALEWFKSVEKLRDRLAHGQDLIVGSSWDELVRTVRTMRVVLGQLEPRLKG